MRKIQKTWWLVATAVAVVVLGALLAVPAWAAVARQGDGPSSGDFSAMHAACVAGDVRAMDALGDEDWEAMGEHMTDGHHGAMGGPMMGSGGMMGTGMGMMGGMVSRRSDQGMGELVKGQWLSMLASIGLPFRSE